MTRRSRIARRPATAARLRPELLALESRDAPALLTVLNLNDSGPNSLRAELGLALNGDTIAFDPSLSGTLTLTSGQLSVNTKVTVQGPGAGVITVSGNSASRVFNVSPNVTGATISGLTIANGRVNATNVDVQGGGVFNAGTLTLLNDTVTNCTASTSSTLHAVNAYGGGVYNSGTLTLTGCNLNNDVASGSGTGNGWGLGWGGGVYSTNSLTANGCVFDTDTAHGSGYYSAYGTGQGGGIATSYTSVGNLTVADSTIQNCNSNGRGYSSGGGIYAGSNLTMTNCTLTGNTVSGGGSTMGGSSSNHAYGGAIYGYGGTKSLTSCTISNNTATSGGLINSTGSEGGGIYSGSGTLTLTGCTVSGNTADATRTGTVSGGTTGATGEGGGVFGGAVTVSGCVFLNNSATGLNSAGTGSPSGRANGGAIDAGTLTISTSLFFNNLARATSTFGTAFAQGGGLYCTGTVSMTDSTVAANTAQASRTGGNGGGATASGGGIYGLTLTVSGSSMTSNTAAAVSSGGSTAATGTANGGGLYSSALTMTNCTVAYNYATGTGVNSGSAGAGTGNGGGLYLTGGSPSSITSSTVAQNAVSGLRSGTGSSPAVANGGGVFVPSGAVSVPRVRNSIVATNALDITSTTMVGPDVDGVVVSQGYNLVGISNGSSGWVGSDLLGNLGTPLDPLLGPLQDNGGPSQTMELLATSPALGSGDPALAGAVDQRGVTRGGPPSRGAYDATLATQLLLVAPASASAGVPFTVTVTAADPYGKTVYNYSGTIFFYSDTDPAAQFPGAAYTFSASDQGSVTLNNWVTFQTAGTQDLYVFDSGVTIGGFTTVVVS